MANRMTPPTEGQEKDVLLVLDKQQGKVSAVKSFDKDGNLQTVSPTHGGEFMQVDKNSDVFSNFISNFFRKFQDTSGLELFSVKASEAEQQARAIEDNHRNPTPEGSKRTEMLRVPKSDFHEFKQGVIVKTCSDSLFSIGQKNCQLFVAKLRNFLDSHNRMVLY